MTIARLAARIVPIKPNRLSDGAIALSAGTGDKGATVVLQDRPDFRYVAENLRGSLLELADVSADGPEDVDFDVDFATGRLLGLRGKFGARTGRPADEIARTFVDEHGRLFGIDSEIVELGDPLVEHGDPPVNGRRRGEVVRLRQMIGRARVYGAGVRVEIDRSGIVTSVMARVVEASIVRRRPRISRDDAVVEVRRTLGIYAAGEIDLELVLTDLSLGAEQAQVTVPRAAWLHTIAGPEGKIDVMVDGITPRL